MSSRMSRRQFLATAGMSGALAGLSLVGCGDAQPQGKAGEGQLGGQMTMYTPNSETLVNGLVPMFEDATGVKVNLIQAGTGELYKKIQSEASDPKADVMWGGELTNQAYASLFQTYTSSEDESVMASYRNETGFSTHYCLDGSVFILNKDLTAGMDIQGYEDLLHDDLAGRIATADPSNSSSAFHHLTQMLLDMGGYESEAAWDYVRRLFTLVGGKDRLELLERLQDGG